MGQRSAGEAFTDAGDETDELLDEGEFATETDTTDGDEDAAAVDEVEAELRQPEPPPLRSRDYKPGHRQTKVKPAVAAADAGPSPWENRPRSGFTQQMAERSPVMSATKEGRRFFPHFNG